MVNLNASPGSRLFLDAGEDDIRFYRRFVQRHGGTFEPVRQSAGSYRLDFPPGTRIARNQDFDLCDSYHVVYPDGVHLTWYRVLRIDRRWLRDVLLAPLPDNDQRVPLEREQARAMG